MATNFPRLGMWWPERTKNTAADYARYDWITIWPWDADRIPTMRALNPTMSILT